MGDRNDLKDPQEAPVVGYCLHCGEEIYTGEEIRIPVEHAGKVHEDCYKDWLYETYASLLGVRVTA